MNAWKLTFFRRLPSVKERPTPLIVAEERHVAVSAVHVCGVHRCRPGGEAPDAANFFGTSLCLIRVDDADSSRGWCHVSEPKQAIYAWINIRERTGLEEPFVGTLWPISPEWRADQRSLITTEPTECAEQRRSCASNDAQSLSRWQRCLRRACLSVAAGAPCDSQAAHVVDWQRGCPVMFAPTLRHIRRGTAGEPLFKQRSIIVIFRFWRILTCPYSLFHPEKRSIVAPIFLAAPLPLFVGGSEDGVVFGVGLGRS